MIIDLSLYIYIIYKGHMHAGQGPKICFPLIHFEPPTRGQPLYKGHNIVLYIWRFHCYSTTIYYISERALYMPKSIYKFLPRIAQIPGLLAYTWNI